MRNQIEMHHSATQTHLPAHEEAARRQRAGILGLPMPPERPQHPAHQPGGRKTTDTRYPNLRH